MSGRDVWLNPYPNPTEALLLRMQKKGHVLRYEGADQRAMAYETRGPDHKKKEVHTQTFKPIIGIYRTKKAKEDGVELSQGEQDQVREMASHLAHCLRPDDEFFREMARLYHHRMIKAYPLGSGADMTPAHEYLARAEKAAAAGKPFEFWVLLLMAARTGYKICRDAVDREVAS